MLPLRSWRARRFHGLGRKSVFVVSLRKLHVCFFDLLFFFRFGLPGSATGFRIDWATNDWPHFLTCSASKPSDRPISIVLASSARCGTAAQVQKDSYPPFSLLNNCMVALASSILECCPPWMSMPRISLASLFKPGVLPVRRSVVSPLPISGKRYLIRGVVGAESCSGEVSSGPRKDYSYVPAVYWRNPGYRLVSLMSRFG